MANAKKKTSNYASLLISDRFSNTAAVSKKHIQRNSVTEFTSLSMLNEKLTVENKVISNSKYSEDRVNEIEEKYENIINSVNYDASIPPRVIYDYVEKGDYKAVESITFNRWKYLQNDRIFERNIEIWRQFWIACERATTIAQIVDARNPDMYFNRDILMSYPTKKHVLLINKSDLVSDIDEIIRRIQNNSLYAGIEAIHAYSSKTGSFDFKFTGTVGLIGYPNVGKSSTVNLILKQKKVKVSATPGKTKYIQTIQTPEFTLLDCPGLVFPGHSKIEFILMGILNVDQIPDLMKFKDLILEYVGEENIANYYGFLPQTHDVLQDMSNYKGWQKSKCLKELTKAFYTGEMSRIIRKC